MAMVMQLFLQLEGAGGTGEGGGGVGYRRGIMGYAKVVN